MFGSRPSFLELLVKIGKWGANRGVLVKLGRKGGISSRPV
jgi:hypothetical protein